MTIHFLTAPSARAAQRPGMPTLHLFAALLALASVAPAKGDEEDTRRLLDNASRVINQQETPVWLPLGPLRDLTVTVGGQTYRVEKKLKDLEPALYVAINTGQWQAVKELATQYRLLSDHKPHLALMADALVARRAGDYSTAVTSLALAHDSAPEDMRVQMELARVYAEDNQDREARRMFERALSNSLPPDTRQLLQNHVEAVDRRSEWQGSLAMGVGRSDNINQANGYDRCMLSLANLCLMRIKLPDPIASSFNNYDLVLSKRIPLSGHHNLIVRTVAYGTNYREKNPDNPALEDFSDDTGILYTGYQFANARHTANITPYFESYRRNGATSYHATGLQADWSYFLTPTVKLGVQAGGKHFQHRGPDARLFADYGQTMAGITATYFPSSNTSLYAGADFYRKKYESRIDSSKETVLRTGAFHQFETGGFFVNVLTMHRRFANDEFSFFYGEQRIDTQNIHIATFGSTRLSIYGAYPELRLKHTDNRSNTIFHGYRQNEVVLQMRKNF